MKTVRFQKEIFAQKLIFPSWILLIVFACFGGCGDDKLVDDDSNGQTQNKSYGGAVNSELIHDTHLRNSRLTQTQGTLATLRIGSEMDGVFDFFILDSGVVYQDSIPAGASIVACTLWLQINQVPHFDGDSIVIDLWSIPELWRENEASWSYRENNVLWNSAGGFGELFSDNIIVARRIELNRFTWAINGVLYDTVEIFPSRHVPVPIDNALAEQTISGLAFGFALRTDSTTTLGASFGLSSSETLTQSQRPYIVWIYNFDSP